MKSLYPQTIQAQIVNASPTDSNFLRSVVALFADPQNEMILDRIRSGNFALQYNPDDGEAYIVDIRTGDAGAPSPVIHFIGRFSDAQWEDIIARFPGIAEIARDDVERAEQIAKEVLGFLPDLKAMEVANG